MTRYQLISSGRAHKSLLVAGAIILLLLVLGVGSWYYVEHRLDEINSSAPEATRKDDRRAALEQKVKDADSADAKAAAYSDLSNYYAEKDQPTQAKKYASEAVDASPTAASYAQLGFAAAQAGDTQAAIEAYDKAAALAKAAGQTDDGRSNYSYYKMQARLLREGKL